MTAQGPRRLALVTFGTTVLLFAASDLWQILIARELGESALSVSDGALPFSLVLLTFPVVGFLLVRRQPSNSVGWILLGIGLCWAVRGFWFDGYLRWTLTVRPGSLPGAAVVGALTFPLWVPMVGLIGTFLILLFPDGALPSRRWRPLGWAAAITIIGLYVLTVVRPGPVEQAPVDDLVNPFGIGALTPILPILDGLTLLLPLVILGCASALVTRFRRSTGVERLQLKWLASAGSFIASGYLLLMASGAYGQLTQAGPPPQWFDFVTSLFFLSFGLIPAAIGVAVLRHGLYGIDRLISRTVSYAVVTGTLLAVYTGLVTTSSRLVPDGNALAVAGSTLAVAALFQPLRRSVQATVDRRFNRARYDAGLTIEEFSRRLRNEVDLATVRTDLLNVVRQTMEPATVGVWLRSREQRTPTEPRRP